MTLLTGEVITVLFRDAAAEVLKDAHRYVSLIHTSSLSCVSVALALFLITSLIIALECHQLLKPPLPALKLHFGTSKRGIG